MAQGAWRVAVTVPTAAVPLAEAALGDLMPSLATFEAGEPGQWLVEGFAAWAPDEPEIRRRLTLVGAAVGIAEPAVEIGRLPPTDWLSRSFQSFPPLRVGRFFIHGSHYHGPFPPSTIALMVDAATAFGSGEHPSTEGCLRAIQLLLRRRRPRRMLDLGCGTGILALALAKLAHRPVLAADIDPEAVRVARHNARQNEAGRWVRAVVSAGLASPAIRKIAPYDLVVANILARPLAGIAAALSASVAPGGFAILSGLLDRDQAIVLAAYRPTGLVLWRRVPVGRWPTLILRRSAQPQFGS